MQQGISNLTHVFVVIAENNQLPNTTSKSSARAIVEHEKALNRDRNPSQTCCISDAPINQNLGLKNPNLKCDLLEETKNAGAEFGTHHPTRTATHISLT